MSGGRRKAILKSSVRKRTVSKSVQKEWAQDRYKGMENLLLPSFSVNFNMLDEEGVRNDVRNSVRHGFFSTMCAPLGISSDEYKQLLAVACDEGHGKILTGAIVGGNSLEDDLDILAYAEKVGCTHVFLDVRKMDHYKAADEQYEAYRQRIDATRLPVVLYASVSRGPREIGPGGVTLEVFNRLADVPSVVAVKLTQPMNLTKAFLVCELLGDRLLVGPVNLDFITLLAKYYRIQWSGQWNVEAIQSPEKPYAVEFMRLINGRKFDEALKVFWQLEPALRDFYTLQAPLILKGGHPWAHMKYYQWCVGGNGGLIRNLHALTDQVPVLDPAGRRRIRDSYEQVGIAPVDAPEEEFLVGKANYTKGLGPHDLKEKPLYA